MAKLEVHPLMATIVDNPDLDAPRLVYADWLDEQGDPKLAILAEYIRLGVELANAPRGKTWDLLYARVQQLQSLDADAVFPPLPKWTRLRVSFSCGLPNGLSCTFQQFATGGARVLELAPVTSVTLGSNSRWAAAAFARPEWIRARNMLVSIPLDDIALTTLARNPAVTTLREVEVNLAASDAAEGVSALATAAPNFSSLTSLNVFGSGVTPHTHAILRTAFGNCVTVNGQPA